MSLTPHVQEELSQRGYSRRQIARIALGAAAVIPFFHEFAFAQDDGAPLARGAVLAEGPYADVAKNPQVLEAYVGTAHA